MSSRGTGDRTGSTPRRLKRLATLGLAVAMTAAITGTAAAQSMELAERLEVPGNTLTLYHWIGEVRIVPATGRSFEVVARVLGDDAEEGLIRLERSDDKHGPVVKVALPLDTSMRYLYPELSRGSSVRIRLDEGRRSDSVVGKVFRRHRTREVKVSGSGRGLELWADVTVRVPAGGSLALRSGVGDIVAQEIDGSLEIDSSLGEVSVEGLSGDLGVDVGNGAVDARELSGGVEIDSGNGAITVADSKSGDVTLDSGNGRVRVEEVTCRHLEIDTGNGPVDVLDISADSAVIDTGNGRVDVVFTRVGSGEFEVDTGNGSVSVQVPVGVSAEIIADTGRGGISFDVEESDAVEILSRERDELHARFGAGEARIVIDSGNGSIEILQ